jgi:hypothetical protein
MCTIFNVLAYKEILLKVALNTTTLTPISLCVQTNIMVTIVMMKYEFHAIDVFVKIV